jgi:hypothetical protein
MNIHTDQRPGYGNENKTGTTGSSGRSTTGDINADLNTLRSDFNALKDTVTDYVSKTGSDAFDSAKKATTDVANKASDLASAGVRAGQDLRVRARADGPQQPPRRYRGRGAGGRRDRSDRARRPKLMLHSILQITGIEQKLESLRSRIEGQAQSLMQHGKAVAIQMAIASALGVGRCDPRADGAGGGTDHAVLLA